MFTLLLTGNVSRRLYCRKSSSTLVSKQTSSGIDRRRLLDKFRLVYNNRTRAIALRYQPDRKA